MKSITGSVCGTVAEESCRSAEEIKRTFLLIFILLIFIAAVVFSVMNLFSLNAQGAQGLLSVPPESERAADVERAAVELNIKLSAFSKMREKTQPLSEIAETAVFSPVSVSAPPLSAAEETQLPEFVPEVKIKALLVLGGRKVCTLEIDGEEADRLFEQGMTFGDGKGMIVSIDKKGVGWKWANKNYRADL